MGAVEIVQAASVLRAAGRHYHLVPACLVALLVAAMAVLVGACSSTACEETASCAAASSDSGSSSGGDAGESGPLPGEVAPAAPEGLAVTATITQLTFTWKPVDRAERYQLLEDADGDGPLPFAQKGPDLTEPHAVVEVSVHRHPWDKAKYAVKACRGSSCGGSSNEVDVRSSMLDAIGYAKESNTGAGDGFGQSVALSTDGSTLAVGAPQEGSGATGVYGKQDDETASDSGAVYVFRRSGGTWAQEAYVKASNTGANDNFGGAVALSADGSMLAVGALYEKSSATGVGGNQNNDGTPFSGAVYVFRRADAGTWAQEAYVKASNTGENDFFGSAVALSADGNTLAVGAPNEASAATGVGGNQNDESAYNAGAAYVFRRAGAGTWAQEAYVKASNTGENDNFGWSVALSADGSTLAVGARNESSAATGVGGNQNDETAFHAGAVYLFRRAGGGTWAQEAYVKASNTGTNDNFGVSVALSADGTTLAVGAGGEGSAATGVGGNQNDETAGRSGAAYVFRRSGVAWAQEAYVKASNTSAGDDFGGALALSPDGRTLAVGATGEASAAKGVGGKQDDETASRAGAAYVFRRADAGAWAQETYVKASNTGAADQFGWCLALSGDGSTLVVGANGESSAATGIGKTQDNRSAAFSKTGAAYIY